MNFNGLNLNRLILVLCSAVSYIFFFSFFLNPRLFTVSGIVRLTKENFFGANDARSGRVFLCTGEKKSHLECPIIFRAPIFNFINTFGTAVNHNLRLVFHYLKGRGFR